MGMALLLEVGDRGARYGSDVVTSLYRCTPELVGSVRWPRFAVRVTGPCILVAKKALSSLTVLFSSNPSGEECNPDAVTCPIRIIALTSVDFPVPVSPMNDTKLGYRL